uniref:UDP-N-acetylmuramoylalanine--D-glutamate ligase n=1 Tax=Thermodesulfobium narugense TaxID=184064 RepID=A0A7C5PQJ5_9BACT
MLLNWDRIFERIGFPKKIVIVGYGKSGFSIAKLISKELASVEIIVTDKDCLKFPEINEINYLLGEHNPKILKDASWIIKSPGVPLNLNFFKLAREKDIPVIGDLDLTFGLLPPDVNTIGVTGTNGKTTITEWIGYGFKIANMPHYIAGNVGTPLSEIIYNITPGSNLVLELSSYQIENSIFLKPRIAMITNLTLDHTDRYITFEDYINAKIHLFKNQESGYSIYNKDDQNIVKNLRDLNLKTKLLSVSKKEDFSIAGVINSDIVVKDNQNLVKITDLSNISIKGEHNIENALFVASSLYLSSVKPEYIEKTLSTFSGVEHRQEKFYICNGIIWINDSKSTNPESTIVALKTWGESKNLILILGGRDKKTPLDELVNLASKTCKAVILFGEAKSRFYEFFKDIQNVFVLDVFDEVIDKAFELAQPKDIVLFSPACASFDMFSNFEERGRIFKKKVIERYKINKEMIV